MKAMGRVLCTAFKSFNTLKINLALILQGFLIGISSGLTVVLYRFLIEKGAFLSKHIYNALPYAPYLVPLWLAVLFITACIVSAVVKRQPLSGGGGVAQVKDAVLKNTEAEWWKVISGRFFCGFLCILSGLSLGRVGPSVHIGALIGQRLNRSFNNFNNDSRYSIISGAGAGLASALNAPLAGTFFALEVIYSEFNISIFVSTLSSAIASSLVSKFFFGFDPIFSLQYNTDFGYTGYIHLIVLGIILGIAGAFFNSMFIMTTSLFKSPGFIPDRFKLIVPFLIAGIMGLTLPVVTGGGNELIVLLNSTSFTFSVLAVLFIAKFCLAVTSIGSGASGGLFFPVLSIGALLGCIYGNIAVALFHLEPGYITLFMAVAMGGYLTAVIGAPVTGIILIMEMTGSYTYLLPIAVVTIVSYITANRLGTKPIFRTMSETAEIPLFIVSK